MTSKAELQFLYMTDPNIVRAVWASKSIKFFMELTGTDEEDAVSDFLCDLMHYCESRKEGADFTDELARATAHFDYELTEDENDG